MKINCPVCKGKGFLVKPKKQSDIKLKIQAASILRKNKYSIREIMALLGYKSPRSVQYILNRKCEKKLDNKEEL